jgi:ubiquinone/menaquinone biosynthesis C-methylase UbiE
MPVHIGGEITQVFRESWNVYQKVVLFNHLNHQQIVEAFAAELEAFGGATEKNANGLRVLDIGVGDGWLPSQLFTLANRNIPRIDQFTGVDSTGEALAIAKTTSALTIPTKNQLWHQADMREYMQQCTSNTFDVICSSYTIHHLDNSEEKGKIALLEDIFRCLSPDSLFLWADIYNDTPGRSRDATVQLWNEERFRQYRGLTDEEKQQVWDHVREFDLPEELEEMKNMMIKVGFVNVKVCYDDGFYSVVLKGEKKE